MTAYHGSNYAVLFDKYNLSSYFQEATTTEEMDTPETTTFGATARAYIAGLRDGTVSLKGLWDGAANAVDAVLSGVIGSATTPILSVGPQGATIALRAILANAHETSLEITGNFEDVVQIGADMQSTGGIDRGLFLKTLAAETSSTNGASQDNAAASTNGYAAHLHCTAVTGSTPTNTVKVQHSTDDAVWADLVTFTGLTTLAASERKTGTGTVNRYLRYTSTIAGSSPSYTYTVTFARR